jgi:uncharacterized protein
MPLLINLRHLERHEVVLKGELPVEDLDIANYDELIQTRQPLTYDLTAHELEDAVLVQGRLQLALDCECARCLKPFRQELKLEHWVCHLPFKGEEAVVIVDDCVDLTPYLREDILLELPRQPLCKPDCRGLLKPADKAKKSKNARTDEEKASAWGALNQLKF